MNMCDCDDPFFLNALPRVKCHPAPYEHIYRDDIISGVFILVVCIIMWLMGYVAGSSNGESKAYREMLQSKMITPVESVQEENNNVQ